MNEEGNQKEGEEEKKKYNCYRHGRKIALKRPGGLLLNS